jgi:hypothetical protein
VKYLWCIAAFFLVACEHVAVERDGMKASYTAFASNAKRVTWTPDSLTIEDRNHAEPAVAVVRTVAAASLIKAGIDAIETISTTGITE